MGKRVGNGFPVRAVPGEGLGPGLEHWRMLTPARTLKPGPGRLGLWEELRSRLLGFLVVSVQFKYWNRGGNSLAAQLN